MAYKVPPDGWINRYDVKFSSLPLQTVTGNGNITIDGKVWTVINFGNASSMTVGGSNGMRIACNANQSFYGVATRSLPAFVIPITNVFPNQSMLGGMRVTVYNSFENLSHDTDSVIFAVDNNTAAAATVGQRWEFDKYWSGTKRFYGRLVLNGLALVAGDDTLTPTTDNVYSIEIPRLGHSISYEKTGVAVGGSLPTPQNMKARIELGSAASPFFQSRINSPSESYLVLGACTANTSGTLDVRFDSLRIETRDDS